MTTVKVKDRVLETSTTTGTGTINLAGAVTGFRTFAAAFTTGDLVAYIMDDGTDWETGIGTFTSGSPNTLARTTVLASSNAGAAVNWGAGTRNVRCGPIADISTPHDSNLNFVDHAAYTVGGTGDATTLTSTKAASRGWSHGEIIAYRAPGANTTGPTVNKDSLGAKNLKLNAQTLLANAYASGQLIIAMYDSTAGYLNWLNPPPGYDNANVVWNGVISPAQLTANTDDYNPTGLATCSTIRLSTDASRNLTGIVAQQLGTIIILNNVGSQDLVLKHDVTSTAANRFYCPNSADFTIKPNGSATIRYDGTSSRWRVIATSSPAAVATTAVTVIRTQIFTASGTYTPNANMLYCVIEAVGSGGGGGGVNGSCWGAAGGGAGGSYSRLVASAATIGASQTVTIGNGGSAGNTSGTNGTAGSDCSLGTLCIGKGGGLGNGATSGTTAVNRAGGSGGVAGTGDFSVPGQDGGDGVMWAATQGFTGRGGDSVLGKGGASGNVVSSGTSGGNAGSNYGAGGSGGGNGNGAAGKAGGAGSKGIVIVTEYCSA